MADTYRTCSIDGCERKHREHGLCNMHYLRLKNTGSTELKARPTLADRFWAKVDRRGPDECWEWTGATTKKGYGKILSDGRLIGAHVVSYQIHGGQLLTGYEVDHTCHNIICVNPNHLRQATRKQNVEYQSGPHSRSTTKVRGVHWDKERKQFVASVGHNNKSIFVGRFATLAEADAAAKAKRAELYTFPEAS